MSITLGTVLVEILSGIGINIAEERIMAVLQKIPHSSQEELRRALQENERRETFIRDVQEAVTPGREAVQAQLDQMLELLVRMLPPEDGGIPIEGGKVYRATLACGDEIESYRSGDDLVVEQTHADGVRTQYNLDAQGNARTSEFPLADYKVVIPDDLVVGESEQLVDGFRVVVTMLKYGRKVIRAFNSCGELVHAHFQGGPTTIDHRHKEIIVKHPEVVNISPGRV